MSVRTTVIINLMLVLILAFSLWSLWQNWQEYYSYAPVIKSELNLAGLEQKLNEIDLENKDYIKLTGAADLHRSKLYGSLIKDDIFYLKEEEEVPLMESAVEPAVQEEEKKEEIVLPDEEEKKPEVEVKPLETPFILLAVLNHRDYSKAILGNKYTDQSYIIQAGDQIEEGYQVKQISGSRVVLEKMEQEINLSFEAVTKRRGF